MKWVKLFIGIALFLIGGMPLAILNVWPDPYIRNITRRVIVKWIGFTYGICLGNNGVLVLEDVNVSHVDC